MYNPVDEEDEFNKEGVVSDRTSVAEFEMLEKQCN